MMDVTWESLEVYIANYTGRTKIIRLLHVADVCTSLRQAAFQLALDIIEHETLDYQTHQRVHKLLVKVDSSANEQASTWAAEAARKAQASLEKLESELKAYKNNLIKESIRMGQQDIAVHHESTGDLSSELRALIRNREYCTTPSHVLQNNMNIIDVSILLGQWMQVQTHVLKIENSTTQTHERIAAQEHLRVAKALALLSQHKYREAAEQLIRVDAAIGSTYNRVISMNDIANFACLLVLATFSRAEILKFLETSTFKPFLDLEVTAREALEAFHKNRYAECFRLLDMIKSDLFADVYFNSHVAYIWKSIREKCYLQYVSVFNNVSLARISKCFTCSNSDAEDIFEQLIQEGKLICTRLNLRKDLIHFEGGPDSNAVYTDSLKLSRAYRNEVERVLTHTNATKCNLQVEHLATASEYNSDISRSNNHHSILHSLSDDDPMEMS